MRYASDDYWKDGNEGASKGLPQITLNAAVEGENFFREQHNQPELTEEEIDIIRTNLNSDYKEDSNVREAQISYAAKYIAFLENQFPDLNEEDRNKFIAAAYKAGPEALRNARMQEQLNDLLNLKGNEKLAIDGDPGGNTEDAITKFLNIRSDELSGSDMNTIYRNLNPDSGVIDWAPVREIINKIWGNNNPNTPNLSVAEPVYKTDEWRDDMQLHLEDVEKAQEHFNNFQ